MAPPPRSPRERHPQRPKQARRHAHPPLSMDAAPPSRSSASVPSHLLVALLRSNYLPQNAALVHPLGLFLVRPRYRSHGRQDLQLSILVPSLPHHRHGLLHARLLLPYPCIHQLYLRFGETTRTTRPSPAQT